MRTVLLAAALALMPALCLAQTEPPEGRWLETETCTGCDPDMGPTYTARTRIGEVGGNIWSLEAQAPLWFMPSPPTRSTITVYSGEPPYVTMVEEAPDGTITINWPVAERCVADPRTCSSMTRSLANVLLAVRNGTWKPPFTETETWQLRLSPVDQDCSSPKRRIEVDPLADDAGRPSKVICR